MSSSPTLSSRRSGRLKRVPDKFLPAKLMPHVLSATMSATKRKRVAEEDTEEEVNEWPTDDEASSEDDYDEPAPPKKKNRPASTQPARGVPTASRKRQVNGAASRSSRQHVASSSRALSRPKKLVGIALAHRNANGLYDQIFGRGDASEKVATEWYHQYQADQAGALTELINLILLSAGCEREVSVDDIGDPENCANRLADLQNVYTEQGITEYPLASRAKSSRSFRHLLVGFFEDLVTLLHETDVLYKDPPLMANVINWVAPMSSSTQRPFRHTATLVALAIMTALASVARKLDDRVTKLTQQAEAEKSKRGMNQERYSAILNNAREAEQNRGSCQEMLQELFTLVPVHRYRDVDAKIRAECMQALGTWIWQLPTYFMEPDYLRYLGWMLSDTAQATRQEVLKQLARLFKRDAEKLGHFIDRFQERLVEMARLDLDINVQVAAISVIEILKDTGMIVPEEIDTIGKLIFDSELRVRRAVVNFFTGCLQDSLAAKVEDMGGRDAIEELLPDEDDDDFSRPRKSWIEIKCLAEILANYDAALEDDHQSPRPPALDVATDIYPLTVPESRVALASQVLYEKAAYLKRWEILSGYLLYDHTASSKSRSGPEDNMPEAALRRALAPDGREEAVLLEALAAAIKLSLAHMSDGEKSRRRRDASDGSDHVLVHLANILPRLLNKFGADASTAIVVLRLYCHLDLAVFQQLRQDSNTYERLLDEICIQFDRHVDRGVVAEASRALLHARRHDGLEEVTDSKLSELWENLIHALRHLDGKSELGMRNNLDAAALTELSNILSKMSSLASIHDCVDAVEAQGQDVDATPPVIEMLVRIVDRGKLQQEDEEVDDLEDEVVCFALKCCMFYFMWKGRSLIGEVGSQQPVPAHVVEGLSNLRKTFEENMMDTISTRGTNDDLRLFATGTLCDMHILFGGLEAAMRQCPGGLSRYSLLKPLVKAIDPGFVDEMIEIYNAAERAYAKLARKELNEPAEDEDPIDDDDFVSDDEGDDDMMAEARQRKELKAEKQLATLAGKLILAMRAKQVDCTGPSAGKLKRRMLRNHNKLGQNLRQILEYTDEKQFAAEHVRSGTSKKKSIKGKGKHQLTHALEKAAVSAETAAMEDDGEEVEEAEEVDEVDEGTLEDLRRRELLDDPIDDADMNENGVHDDHDEPLDDIESMLGD